MEIFAVNLGEYIDNNVFRRILGCLSNEKREKIKRFARFDDVKRTVVSETLIRHIVKAKLGEVNIIFEKNAFGKPFVKGMEKIHFNISHSGDWVVCAIDDVPIGIDIEKISPIDWEIATNIFSEEECQGMLKRDNQERLLYFYDLWTLKESYVKAIGKGLSLALNTFSIMIYEDKIEIKTQGQNSKVYFKQYDIDSKYKLSVCATNNLFPDGIKILGIKELMKN